VVAIAPEARIETGEYIFKEREVNEKEMGRDGPSATRARRTALPGTTAAKSCEKLVLITSYAISIALALRSNKLELTKFLTKKPIKKEGAVVPAFSRPRFSPSRSCSALLLNASACKEVNIDDNTT
jgi:hypothetical protein